jgi:hypothetical protein
VSSEGPGWSEFAQLVADHVFCDEQWNMTPAIVNGNGQSQHVWHDRRCPRPSPYDGLTVALTSLVNLLPKFLLHKWAFFN